jgi:outer membrane scaffolding protein for murein synthesis (MipA/OmpV family)
MAGMLALPASGAAQMPPQTTRQAPWQSPVQATAPAAPAETPDAWRFEIGALGGLRPDYEGSNDYSVMALPLLSVSWRDTLSLSVRDGLQGRFRLTDQLRLTGGVGYWFGREQDDNDALKGLGDLSANAIGNLGLDYTWRPLTLGIRLARDIGGDRDGTTATLRGSYALPTGDRWSVRLSLSATWADDNYMDAMFGISPEQARRSQRHYRAFDAAGGVKDVRFGTEVSYRLTSSVSLVGQVSAARLLGDAADSPLVDQEGSANQFTMGLGLSYRF